MIATKPVDFRKGHDGLAAVAEHELGLDPHSGVIVVFRAKRGDRIKVLLWDGSGMVMSYKRLEHGKFAWPGISDGVMRLSKGVRFGMIPSLTRSVLTPALQSFKSQYPTVELSLLEEYSYSLMRRVLDGELDFAIVPSGDLPAGLTATFIGRDREMLISAPTRDTGAAHLSPVPLKALSGARLIVPSALNVRRKYLDSVLSAHGVNIAETLEMDGMLATLEMVAATDWVAILPSAICYPDKSGTQRKLNVLCDPPINLDYVIVEKTEAAPPTAANLLAEQIITQTTVILNDWDDLATG